MRAMKKLIASTALSLLATLGAAGISHADTTTSTDPCRNEGNGTIIAGNNCGPETPTMKWICDHGYAHAIVGNTDYCPAPAVVLVGEMELGTTYVPHIFAPTRLDVAMRRTSTQSMRYRCSHMGGRLNYSKNAKAWVCRGVDY